MILHRLEAINKDIHEYIKLLVIADLIKAELLTDPETIEELINGNASSH